MVTERTLNPEAYLLNQLPQREYIVREPRPDFYPIQFHNSEEKNALYQVVNNWGDKDSYWVLSDGRKIPHHELKSDYTPESMEKTKILKHREVNLYSYGNKVAIATFSPEQNVTLQVADEQTEDLLTHLIQQELIDEYEEKTAIPEHKGTRTIAKWMEKMSEEDDSADALPMAQIRKVFEGKTYQPTVNKIITLNPRSSA